MSNLKCLVCGSDLVASRDTLNGKKIIVGYWCMQTNSSCEASEQDQYDGNGKMTDYGVGLFNVNPNKDEFLLVLLADDKKFHFNKFDSLINARKELDKQLAANQSICWAILNLANFTFMQHLNAADVINLASQFSWTESGFVARQALKEFNKPEKNEEK